MIAKPNKEARKEMLRAARGKSATNSFFVSKETGEIVSSAWRDEVAYFPTVPKGTYEIHIRAGISNVDLGLLIEEVVDLQVQGEEIKELEKKQIADIKELASYSDEVLKGNFGFSMQRIQEIRKATNQI
jgi:hypothetical protein